jgi:hypothetical protein
MSKPSSAPAPAPYTIPGTLPDKAITERNKLFGELVALVSAIPGIVSALPKGITLAKVLTAGMDPTSIGLFSTFFWNKLDDVQRKNINETITVLFSEQKHARANSPSRCFLWPSHDIDYRRSISTRDGANIIAPNLWLYLSLEDCRGSFYSVGLVETYFVPWLKTIQDYLR